jgi:hypothetical protein
LIEFNAYNDGIIAVSLIADDGANAERNLLHLAVRWLKPMPYRGKDGMLVHTTNCMGGETDLFKLPHTFGAAVGCKLVEQKVAGVLGFDEQGFTKLTEWLVDMNELDDAMSY